MTLNGCSTTRRAHRARIRRAMRSGISSAVLMLLVVGLSVWTSASPAGAAPGPWTWVKATASGTGNTQGSDVLATCPSGYVAVTGGYKETNTFINEVRTGGSTYGVHAYSHGGAQSRTDVYAWCARADQVDIIVTTRRLVTNQPVYDVAHGIGDFACDGDRTPVNADLATSSGLLQINQSGPETIGATNEWFVGADGLDTSSWVDVNLLCVANADLPGATWVTQSATAGNSTTYESVTAACPTGQRLVTGGEHVDSVNGDVTSSIPLDSQTWTSGAYVPRRDTLSVSVLCLAAGDPVATITSGPGQVLKSTTATFTFTALDPAGGNAYNYCFLNTSGLGPCAGSYTVTGLTEGQNVFAIEAYTDDGRGWATTEKDYYFWVDLTRPAVTLKKPALFTLGTTVPLQASGTDNQAVDHYTYSVVARQATGTGASTAAPVTKSYTSTNGKLSLAVKAGMSYRVSTKAVDWAGNSSATAATASTAVPLDNLALSASSQWTLIKGSVYTNNLVSRTTKKGATLAEPVYATKLGVVATTCPTCGQLGVYTGSALIKTIDLHATATHYKQVTAISLGTTPKQTTVTLKVLSTNKLVEVDGVGAIVN